MQNLKEFFDKIFLNDNFLKRFTGINVLAIIYFFIISGLVSIIIMMLPDQYNKFSTLWKIQELKKSYNYFVNEATDKEKFNRWVELFYGCRYSQSGITKFYKYDCSSAIVKYFKSFGAEVAVENVKDIEKRIFRLYNSKGIQLRQRYVEVQVGDIVIFYPIAGNYHIGVVGYKSSGYICVMDVNGKNNTLGFSYYLFGDSKINLISEMSFQLWVGDILNEVK